MVRLVPMTEEEFEDFMVISMRDQAQGQVQAGAWRAEEADRNIRLLRSQFLPAGLATPSHFFYSVEEVAKNAKVGGLWFLVEEEEGKLQLFVVDIQIYDAYRRHGYGSQAFKAMEGKAREMGILTVSLHVFGHNTPARAMYEKLGYVGRDTTMSKQLEDLASPAAADEP
jgi:GNAT superfamily N-acetyltransferase